MTKRTELPDIHNLVYVESLYTAFQRDAASVPAEWREYFAALPNGDGAKAVSQIGPTFQPRSLFHPTTEPVLTHGERSRVTSLQDRVNQLIRNYRVRGHMIARIDPLARERPVPPELALEYFGFTEADLERRVSCETMQHCGVRTLGEIYEHLRNTYCRSIGVQYMHIDDIAIRRWLQRRMEGTGNRVDLSRTEQLRILTRLTDAVTFEEFIRKKFVGAKSFSLEGSESLIPLLDLAIEAASGQGIREIVLGMAHRGRLNVLANIMGKSPRDIFREFADADPQLYTGRGDVKYHLGYSNDYVTSTGQKLHLSLCFNPSHLEFVNPVVLGRTRAKQDRVGDDNRDYALALMIHGDAAFAGEGVAQETLNLSRLGGYRAGGTLHVVVNNQIGFTTSPREGRSYPYAADIAKMLQVPIFHVNGEDPEAVAQVVRVSMEFRQKFKRDVVIDMYGYRRLGHNEGDEPSFTQPALYRAIEKRKPVREGYLDHLLQLNGITREEADKISEERRAQLEKELSVSRSKEYSRPPKRYGRIWANYTGGAEADAEEAETRYDAGKLAELLRQQTRLPADFHPHPKIEKFLEGRVAMADGKAPVDWSAAEALALATLAVQGHRIRLSGQDSGRGTFSQRHGVLHDYEDGHIYVPLQNLAKKQGPVRLLNSPLSEAGVLGFDYGYSLDFPDALVMWEAQFGDFLNAGQVIVDQFIVSAEDKWNQLSGLVLLLPHGFEGMGPEHSSARFERLLTMAAEDNIQVVYPTTASQYFHLLRRQVLRRWRKPLFVMTPKSLLRDPRTAVPIETIASGRFQRVIADEKAAPDQVRRILICTGKVYFELEKHRQDLERDDVAIVRLEQLYPLPRTELRTVLEAFPADVPVTWVQEEPANMGAMSFLRVQFGERIFGRAFAGVSRPPSASPATGSANSHKQEQQALLELAIPRDADGQNAQADAASVKVGAQTDG